MTDGATGRADVPDRSIRTVAGEVPSGPDEVGDSEDTPPAPSATRPVASDPLPAPTDTPPALGEVPPVADGTPAAPDFRTALVSGITVDLPNQHPTVVLRESESPRRQLSFSVSLQDGVVLSHAIRRIPTPRPLTHELLSEVLAGFDVDVVALRLVGRQGTVYFAELDLRGRNGRSVHSCRPSDGLALALIQPVPVPILIDARLFEEIGDVTPGPSPPAS